MYMLHGEWRAIRVPRHWLHNKGEFAVIAQTAREYRSTGPVLPRRSQGVRRHRRAVREHTKSEIQIPCCSVRRVEMEVAGDDFPGLQTLELESQRG